VNVRLRPTKKVLLALGVVALLSAGLCALVYRLQSQQRAEWEARLQAKQKEADAVEAAAAQLPQSEARLEEMRYLMSFLRSAEPNDFQPALVLELSSLAQRSGVVLSSFNVAEATQKQQSPVAKTGKTVAAHRFMTIDMVVEGSFDRPSRFLYRMMGLSKVVSVDGVQVQPLAEGALDAVRASVKMTAYVVKDVAPQMAAAATKLKEIAIAQQTYHDSHQSYGKLNDLHAEGLITLKEGEIYQGYVFTTDRSTGSGSFKILAEPKDTQDPKLHRLSIDQSKQITDETDKVPYE